jgi:hypothetical protein
MILDLSVTAFTLVHVVISLVAMAAGLVVLAGMLAGRRLAGWTEIFLLTMAATSLTGFLFPAHGFDPARVVGVISLVALGVTGLAFYAGKLRGLWRLAFVVGATYALYLDVFVGVVQAFQKIAPLKRLAPTQTEPPFDIAQVATLAIFVALGVFAARRFHFGRA